MRVITGSARGRKLKTLEGVDVRPTTDRVKEAVFSIVQFDVQGAAVLDLFAGSGQMGIEALSRGAKLAVFVDSSKRSLEVVRDNLKTTGLAPSSRVVTMDYKSFLAGTRDQFDIAFLDPPYHQGKMCIRDSPYVDTVWSIREGRISKIENKKEHLAAQAELIKDKCSHEIADETAFQLEHVQFSVKGREILKDVTFQIKKGERVLLLGENGCGKTTLLRLLARLYQPTQGRISQKFDPALGQLSLIHICSYGRYFRSGICFGKGRGCK